MNQQTFFEKVIRTPEKLEIPYMIAGSVAAVVYGEPRLTIDMDVILELRPDRAGLMASEFPPPNFYFPTASASRQTSSRVSWSRSTGRKPTA